MDAFVIGGNSSYFLLNTSSYLILVCIVENLMNGGNWGGSFHCVSLIANFSLKVSGNSLQAFPPLRNGKHKDNLRKNMMEKFC